MTVPSIRSIAVVVPARNEEELLPRCIEGIAVARAEFARNAAEPVETEVVLVLDSCDDASEAIARESGAHVVRVEAHNVGVARAVGVQAALELLPRTGLERLWIANTDADSLVPPDWFLRQKELADDGWDVILGRVQPDPADLPAALHRHARAGQLAAPGQPVYGANLGVRAAAYLAAGGFASTPEHEDRRLVEALRRDGASITSSADLTVLTSGRVAGRTPSGYAGFLRDALAR